MSRFMTGALTLAVVALSVGLAINFVADRERDRREASRAFIQPETIRRTEDSVYIVTIEDEHLGTAWLLDRDCGVFVTNAHVAESFDPDNLNLSVKAPHTGKAYRVAAMEVHPATQPFVDVVDQFGPMSRHRWRGRAGRAIAVIPGYDLALLFLTDDCSSMKPVDLGPALKIASSPTIANVAPGDPIAAIGFPGSRTSTSAREDETVIPRSEVGSIRALIPYIPDSSMQSADRFLPEDTIAHTLNIVGGNSGSPMINVDGNVIGIIFWQHIGGEGYGLNAELVRQMRALPNPEWQLEEKMAEWQAELETFASAHEWLEGRATERIERYARHRQKTPIDISSDTHTGKFGRYRKSFPFTVHSTTDGDTPPPEPRQVETQNEKEDEEFSIDRPGRYFRTQLKLSPNRHHLIAAVDYDFSAINNLCPIEINLRKVNEVETLKRSKGVRPRVYLEPGLNETNETIDIVFRRLEDPSEENRHIYCGRETPHFHYVIASWDETDLVSGLDIAKNSAVTFIERLGRADEPALWD